MQCTTRCRCPHGSRPAELADSTGLQERVDRPSNAGRSKTCARSRLQKIFANTTTAPSTKDIQNVTSAKRDRGRCGEKTNNTESCGELDSEINSLVPQIPLRHNNNYYVARNKGKNTKLPYVGIANTTLRHLCIPLPYILPSTK